MNESDKRGCYCDLWEKSPQTLEKQGVPRGYCGICEICKAPGHTRQAPGATPYTGSWCDRCYRGETIRHYMLWVGLPLIVIATLIAYFFS